MNDNEATQHTRGNISTFFEAKSIRGGGRIFRLIKKFWGPLAFLRRYGYSGDVCVVTPKHQEICGYPSYGSIESLPEVPQLALIMTPGEGVADAIRACGEKALRRPSFLVTDLQMLGTSPSKRSSRHSPKVRVCASWARIASARSILQTDSRRRSQVILRVTCL